MKHFFTLTLITIAVTVNAQWYQTVGPGQSSVNALVVNGNNVYAATDGKGFHFSPDSAATWRSIHLGLTTSGASDPSARLMSMSLIHDTLYAGIYAQGMFYFSNTLKKWKAINTGIGGSSTFHSILNLNDTVILIAGSAMLRSTNGGLNWKPSGTGLTSATYKLLQRGNVIYTAGYNGGLFKSTDFGYTWTKADSGLKITSSDVPYVNALVQTSSAVFASVTNSTERAIYKLADGSQVWTLCKNGYTNNGAPTAMLVVNDSIYAGCSDGIYKSADNGNNWVKSNSGLITYTPVASLASNGTDIYLGGQTNGPNSQVHVYKSSDHGKTWRRMTSLVNKYSPNAILADGNNIYVAVSGGYNEGGVYKSSDLGVSWPNTKMPGLDFNVSCIYKMGNTFFAGGESFNGVGQTVYRWTDTSTVWQKPANTNLYQYTRPLGFASKNDSLFMAVADGGTGGPDGGVYLSTDKGGSWSRVSTGIPGDDVTAITVSGGDLFIATRGVMRSSGNGANWTAANGNLPAGYQAEKIYSHGDTLVASSYAQSPYYSTDKGQTWNAFGSATYPGGSDGTLRDMAFSNGRWYVATNSKGVYVSDDHAATWKTFNEGLNTYPSTYTIAVSNGKIFAGAYIRSASGNDSIQVPVFTGLRAAALASNELLLYPNPCRDELFFATEGDAKLVVVFDMSGRVVLHVPFTGKPGSINTSVLGAGLYFIRINFRNGDVLTRKFIKE